jgi:hypothetical protein
MNVAYGTYGQMTAYNPPAGGGTAQADECAKAEGKVEKWAEKEGNRSTKRRRTRLAYWEGKQRIYCEQYEADIRSQRAETDLMESFLTDDTAGIVYPDMGSGDAGSGEGEPGTEEENGMSPLVVPAAVLLGIGALGLVAMLIMRR